ncbi:hypothetical protein FRC14_005149 [Serendipita sp. 396]|nr:hypothetical protein FRC14_005149 [Serendipita sp. 396]
MGNDGGTNFTTNCTHGCLTCIPGSIPDRRDLVKTKAKVSHVSRVADSHLNGLQAEQADKQNQVLAKWFFCALSKRPLQEPIVSCELGKLYNKDAIVEYLLDKTIYGDGATICGHVKGLKDVKQLRLTPNPAPVDPNLDRPQAAYVCPLTLKEMNGGLPFLYLSTCGCVFSATGLRALSSPAESSTPLDPNEASTSKSTFSCPQCSAPYDRLIDVRTLNPTPEEEVVMREAMEARRAAKKANTKSKKRKAAELQTEEEEQGAPAAESSDHKKQKTIAAPAPAPKTNSSVASMTKKVASSLAEEEAKRKAKMSDAVASLYAPKNAGKKKETFMTMGTFTRYA